MTSTSANLLLYIHGTNPNAQETNSQLYGLHQRRKLLLYGPEIHFISAARKPRQKYGLHSITHLLYGPDQL